MIWPEHEQCSYCGEWFYYPVGYHHTWEECEFNQRVETLSREFHQIYQEEAKRQGDVRHPDNYDSLPENIKEFDRVLARYVLENVERLRQK